MRWRRWTGGRIGGIVAALFIALAGVLHSPAVLAFPYQQRVGSSIVHAEAPIDPRIADEIARADRLLAASPLHTGPIPHDLYLTDGGWRWNLLALTSRGAFAFRRPFGDAIVVNRSDVAGDRVFNGAAIGGERSLSGVIAHETTHILLARHFGELAIKGKPVWKQEGYADYVAQESSLSDVQAAALRASGRDHPALIYHDGRKRVAAILAANGGSVDRLFD